MTVQVRGRDKVMEPYSRAAAAGLGSRLLCGKADAEKIVLDANAPGFATMSIRPRMVWGPGSILFDMLIDMARAGQFAWIEGGRHTTDVTFVDNCVEGLKLGDRK